MHLCVNVYRSGVTVTKLAERQPLSVPLTKANSAPSVTMGTACLSTSLYNGTTAHQVLGRQNEGATSGCQ